MKTCSKRACVFWYEDYFPRYLAFCPDHGTSIATHIGAVKITEEEFLTAKIVEE